MDNNNRHTIVDKRSAQITLQLRTLLAVHDGHEGTDACVLDKISAKAGGLLVGLADGLSIGLVAVVGGGESQG